MQTYSTRRNTSLRGCRLDQRDQLADRSLHSPCHIAGRTFFRRADGGVTCGVVTLVGVLRETQIYLRLVVLGSGLFH